MFLHSSLTKKEYLQTLRDNMAGHFELGCERFTGFFISNCFYVTHHAGYEWNRRITNQKNAAMGYVKECADGCHIHFLRFRGALCPVVFLNWMLLATLFVLVTGTTAIEQVCLFYGCFLATAPISALFESFTQDSIEGHRSLLSLLIDPNDPYKNYDYLP